MSWTNDRVNLLKQLWGEGRTASEIARELGGVSRNAVIGKAYRMKLSGRASPIKHNSEELPSSAHMVNSSVASSAKAGTGNLTRIPANEQQNKKESPEPIKARKTAGNSNTGAKKSLVEEKKNNIGTKLKLANLRERMCRWPSGDPQDKDFHFCGERTLPGMSYCEKHSAMAYQSSHRNRSLKEAEEIADRENSLHSASTVDTDNEQDDNDSDKIDVRTVA